MSVYLPFAFRITPASGTFAGMCHWPSSCSEVDSRRAPEAGGIKRSVSLMHQSKYLQKHGGKKSENIPQKKRQELTIHFHHLKWPQEAICEFKSPDIHTNKENQREAKWTGNPPKQKLKKSLSMMMGKHRKYLRWIASPEVFVRVFRAGGRGAAIRSDAHRSQHHLPPLHQSPARAAPGPKTQWTLNNSLTNIETSTRLSKV